MTDRENDLGRSSGAGEIVEGGCKPALSVNSKMVTANATATDRKIGKVYDLSSLDGFAKKMAAQVQNNAVSRDDALEMIADVVRYRKLTDAFGESEVCAIIEDAFLRVVDHHDAEAEIEPVSFPGVIRADQLQIMEYEPVMLVIPPLIAEGVTLLAGKPKLGKSWLTLDIALAIAGGRPALGNLPTLQGAVLGLFLEDSKGRLQSRIGKLVPAGDAWPSNLAIATEWPRIDDGGLSDIEAWCRQAPNAKAIVIDTLAKFRPAKVLRKAPYDLDYEALTGLQRIALKYHVAIIVVHHTRKAGADDIFDTVSGTLGLTGAADTILVLSKRSGKAVLHARGRDIADSETALKFDPATCRWVAEGDASDVFISDQRTRILAALDDASEPMSPKELMLATGVKNKNRNSIDIMLLKMVREGQIERAGRGKYVSSGKIGKKDQAADQTTEMTNEISTNANLSDLSAKDESGDPVDERTTP